MKKQLVLTFLIVTIGVLFVTGCGTLNTGKDNTSVQNEPVTSTEPAVDPDDFLADDMSITSEDAKELFIMRIKDDYIELNNNCEEVYCLDSAVYPEMSDGSIVHLVADVDIYDGGEAGYCHNAFLKKVVDTESVNYAEAASVLGIPELLDNDFEYGQYILQYSIGDDLYFALFFHGDVILYQDGDLVYEYEYSGDEDYPETLYKFLSTRTYTPPTADVPQVMPGLTEDEILNMDVIHLRGYGDLLAEGLLIDVSTPNCLREEYNLSREDGYIGIGRHADRSAETESDALQTAKDFWAGVGSSFISYDNIKLIGESAEFWLFQADYSMNGEFKAIDTLIVYKKDYYDAGLKKIRFEPDDESIRHFFAVRSMESVEKSCCIGEFVDISSGVFSYRRYDLQITNDENDEGKITIELYETEYCIDEDGQITQIDHFEPLHEL